MLFGLNSDVARALTEQFASQSIDKTYFAIVRGYTDDAGLIDYALKEKLDPIADKLADQDKDAQSAQTEYQTLATFELPHSVGRYLTARYSLVKLAPKTGRKHQLRRHMAHISHPIVGDTTHGDGKHNKFVRQIYAFNGLALTCNQMVLDHPVTGERINVKTHFDDRMTKLLASWGWERSELRKIS